jgi:hypothetical protein
VEKQDLLGAKIIISVQKVFIAGDHFFLMEKNQ